MCRQSANVCLIKSPSRQHRALPHLSQRLVTLADPRHWRGRRHSFVSVLLIACSAVLAGARSFTAIGQWAKSAPQTALARLGARVATVFSVRVAPSAATVRRVLNAVCPGGLADLLGTDPAGAGTLAVDGKSARGSRTVNPTASCSPARGSTRAPRTTTSAGSGGRSRREIVRCLNATLLREVFHLVKQLQLGPRL
ncbi:transposase family protein [Streptomyces bobili]